MKILVTSHVFEIDAILIDYTDHLTTNLISIQVSNLNHGSKVSRTLFAGLLLVPQNTVQTRFIS